MHYEKFDTKQKNNSFSSKSDTNSLLGDKLVPCPSEIEYEESKTGFKYNEQNIFEISHQHIREEDNLVHHDGNTISRCDVCCLEKENRAELEAEARR